MVLPASAHALVSFLDVVAHDVILFCCCCMPCLLTHCERPGIPAFRGRAWCTRNFYFVLHKHFVVVVVVVVAVVGTKSIECRRC